MPTVILIATLFTLAVDSAQDGIAVAKAVKAIHHHSTAVVYHHVLKPVGHAVKKTVQREAGK